MTSPTAPPAVECPHGLRPGTTICLRCRQDARLVARQRRVRFAARVGVVVMGSVVAIALIVGAWQSIARDGIPSTDTVPPSPRPTDSLAAAGARSTPRVAAVPVIEPSIAEGRRQLGDSVFAIREGGQVTVHFDTETLRTRFDWKFEGVVRATLPLVFGPVAGAALDSIPAGTLANGGQLMTELPRRGIPIRLGTQTLMVWPVTRPGRDGPLVVGYRAAGR
jgi:hypothetical protein